VNEKIQRETPLHFASYGGSKDVVEYLLAFGASIEDKANSGATALHIACIEGHTEVVRCLLAKGANVNEPAYGYTLSYVCDFYYT
jgi:tankyrase